jgi:hypothetical protein
VMRGLVSTGSVQSQSIRKLLFIRSSKLLVVGIGRPPGRDSLLSRRE